MGDTETKLDVSEKEQEKQDSVRWGELKSKGDLTEPETKEKEILAERYAKKAEGRIGELTYRAKTAEENLSKKDQEILELQKKINEKPPELPAEPMVVNRESLTIGDNKHFTDTALQSMVDAGEMTSPDAFKYQKIREKAEMQELVKKEVSTAKETFQKEGEADVRAKDAEDVLKRKPELDEKHADHNPNDPFFKKFKEIYNNGYAVNPKGFTMAYDLTVQVMGTDKPNPDLSANLGLHSSSAPPTSEGKPPEVEFTADEEEIAVRQFVFGNQINSATGKVYTDSEAIEKAKKSKKELIERRKRI